MVHSSDASDQPPAPAIPQLGAVHDHIAHAELPSLSKLRHSFSEVVFDRSLAWSLYYVARSALFVTLLVLALHAGLVYLEDAEAAAVLARVGLPLWAAKGAGCALYVFLQGTVFFGLFTIAHDCGHSSFSPFAGVNWVVGNALNAVLLVPFEAWRITHRIHHQNTGNMVEDEIFTPLSNWRARMLTVFSAGLGWVVYLFVGMAPRYVNHFSPSHPEFALHRNKVRISVLSVVAVAVSLLLCVVRFGFGTVALYYGAPYCVFCSWLLCVTFLHHNDEDTPWYRDGPVGNWDYVRGNLSSIDRDFGGLVLNNLTHDINLHQVHHLFPAVPHYRLRAATREFRRSWPALVRDRSHTHMLVALGRSLRDFLWHGDGAALYPTAGVWTYSAHKRTLAAAEAEAEAEAVGGATGSKRGAAGGEGARPPHQSKPTHAKKKKAQ